MVYCTVVIVIQIDKVFRWSVPIDFIGHIRNIDKTNSRERIASTGIAGGQWNRIITFIWILVDKVCTVEFIDSPSLKTQNPVAGSLSTEPVKDMVSGNGSFFSALLWILRTGHRERCCSERPQGIQLSPQFTAPVRKLFASIVERMISFIWSAVIDLFIDFTSASPPETRGVAMNVQPLYPYVTSKVCSGYSSLVPQDPQISDTMGKWSRIIGAISSSNGKDTQGIWIRSPDENQKWMPLISRWILKLRVKCL